MGNDATSTTGVDVSNADFGAIQESGTFQELRRKQRGFVFPVLIVCMVWYFGYVLLAAYAKDFMGTPLIGSFNVGLLLGLLQVVTTFAVTMWYVSFANRELDPIAAEIRDSIEAGKEVK
ncbi:MAG TPA: DUF485 domain-containing protein [Microbacteriaceae bacterium]|nr:DUF485 domain-containing protein [Microbacteriaceae bacterium]